jgi:signal peptidase II
MPQVSSRRFVLFAALVVLGCAADLFTKAWVFAAADLRAGDVRWLWEGHVGIQLSRNWGALFGIGQGMTWLFAALSILAAIAIPVWLLKFRAAHDLLVTVALGCIMAGVLGNLYDRLGLSQEDWVGPGRASSAAAHAVRDWILWQANDQWRWPNFNIADSLLVAGAALLFVRLVRQPAESDSNEPTGDEVAPSARDEDAGTPR